MWLASAVVDASNFEVAVEHPATERTFLLLAPDDDLAAAQSGSIELCRVFLHSDQRKLVHMIVQAQGVRRGAMCPRSSSAPWSVGRPRAGGA